MKRFWWLIPVLFVCSQAWAAGGTCPSGSNYIVAQGPPTATTLSALGITSCFYADASGSDSNSGTSESSPWLHLPGMGGCSNTCSSTTISAGEGFILRGGDTWHASSGSPSICSSGPCTWSWSHSGSSGSPIYIGIDPTWYNTSNCSSFCRPVLSMDNTITTSIPSSCTYDDSDTSGISTGSSTYVIVDGFEFTGKCWAQNISNNSVAYVFRSGSNVTVERTYMHGWSMTSAGWDGHAMIGGANGGSADGNIIASVVIDGSDSTHSSSSSVCSEAVNGAPCNTGWAIQGGCYDVHNSILKYVSNGLECGNITYVYGNLFIYEYATINGNTLGGPHPNVVETDTGYTGQNFVAYNNLAAQNLLNVNWWPQAANHYLFNNVIWSSGTAAANCIMLSPVGNSSGSAAATAYIYNNTLDDDQGNGCEVQMYGQTGNSTTEWVGGTTYFQNNHFVGYGSPGSLTNTYTFGPNASGTITDNGGEKFMSASTASSQGYTTSNNYAPTSGTSGTVGAGNNLTSSFCSILPDSYSQTACQSATSSAVAEVSGWGGYVASYPGITLNSRPSSGTWDAGAYQYESGTSSTVIKQQGATKLQGSVIVK